MSKIGVIGAVGVLLAVLTGCKEVDRNRVGAVLVEGTTNLYSFCDSNGTLIYFTDRDGSDDEYEAFWQGVCKPGNLKPGAGSETTGGDGE